MSVKHNKHYIWYGNQDRMKLTFLGCGGEIIKAYIKSVIFVVVIIAAIFFGVYKIVSYGEYTEEYSYEL